MMNVMDNRYNLSNFEASFKTFLLAGNKNGVFHPNTIKNYLSDLRHFLGWSVSQQSLPSIETVFSLETISKYKGYLSNNGIPLKTINRRLSALRKFCSFCIAQGWMTENPAKKIQNVGLKIKPQIETKASPSSLLNEFKQYLIGTKTDEVVIQRYMNTLEQLIGQSVINSNDSL